MVGEVKARRAETGGGRSEGRLVYVMGPSGAGKDSVLGFARERVAGRYPIAFAHRYITRPATAGGENHVALSLAEFALRRECGLFAMTWEAHGLRYGIGTEIELWRRAGLTVVVSGSRAHFLAEMISADALPVAITADPDVIAKRLVARGRESGPAIAERIQRSKDFAVAHPRLAVVDNSGPLERAGQRLVDLLAAACRG